MKKIKSILALVLVLIMAMAATSTVFARGFGGGRMAQGQRQCAIEQCRFDELDCLENCLNNCISFDADGNVIFTLEYRGLGMGLGRGACRRLP